MRPWGAHGQSINRWHKWATTISLRKRRSAGTNRAAIDAFSVDHPSRQLSPGLKHSWPSQPRPMTELCKKCSSVPAASKKENFTYISGAGAQTAGATGLAPVGGTCSVHARVSVAVQRNCGIGSERDLDLAKGWMAPAKKVVTSNWHAKNKLFRAFLAIRQR